MTVLRKGKTRSVKRAPRQIAPVCSPPAGPDLSSARLTGKRNPPHDHLFPQDKLNTLHDSVIWGLRVNAEEVVRVFVRVCGRVVVVGCGKRVTIRVGLFVCLCVRV